MWSYNFRDDNNDYLMHRSHKYIDRNWVNGKWQYVYKKVEKATNTLGRTVYDALGGKEVDAKNKAFENASKNPGNKESFDKFLSAKAKSDKTIIGKAENAATDISIEIEGGLNKAMSKGKKIADKIAKSASKVGSFIKKYSNPANVAEVAARAIMAVSLRKLVEAAKKYQ